MLKAKCGNLGCRKRQPKFCAKFTKYAYIWFCLREPKTIIEFHNFIPKLVTFADAKLKHEI